VGLEIDQPILTPEALSANVTNEGGVYDTFRLLKNVMGLWILQQCRATWEAEGEAFTYAELVDMATRSEPFTAIINPNDPVFLSPGDHPQRIREFCHRTGQHIPETPGRIVRCILESLALAYREVLELTTSVSNQQVSKLHIVGGGAQNDLLNQMTANATGLPVIAGPIEATVIGNAIVQLITLGEITDLNQARQIVDNLTELKRYEPEENADSQSGNWEQAYEYFQSHYSMTDDIH
jgi:rhamnulokinase